MAPHSSTLAWKISWTEEPGRLQSMGSQDEAETKKLVDGFLRISMELPPAFATTAMTAAREGTERIPKGTAVMNLMRHPQYKEWRAKFGKNLNENYEV